MMNVSKMIIWRREFHFIYEHISLVSSFVFRLFRFVLTSNSIWSNTLYFCAFGAFILVRDWILLVCFLFLHVFFNFFSLYISKVNTTHYWMMMNISIDKTESFENDSLVIFMHNTTCSISWSWFQFLFFFDPYFNFILIV